MREFRFGEEASAKHVCGARKLATPREISRPKPRFRLRPVQDHPTLYTPILPPPPSESSELATNLQDEHDLVRTLATELDEPPDVGDGDDEQEFVGIDETIRHEELRLEREERQAGSRKTVEMLGASHEHPGKNSSGSSGRFDTRLHVVPGSTRTEMISEQRMASAVSGEQVEAPMMKLSDALLRPYRINMIAGRNIFVALLKLGKMQLHFAPPSGDRGTNPSTRIAAVRLPHPHTLPVLSHVPLSRHETLRRGSGRSTRQNDPLLSDWLLEDVGLAPRRATSPKPIAIVAATTGVDGDLDLRVRLACLSQDEREMSEHVERALTKEMETRDQARRWVARKNEKSFMRLQRRVEDIAASGE
ncbi:hypothetical protein BJ742DRAFT_775366 [Cladochytrium replicatum]|nr:hypothetical protein BJ742DRAFT_775366 [Cladochytrium replicatum]